MHRSLHFVPAHKKAFLQKIDSLGADQIVIELEDGVGDSDKALARSNMVKFFENVDPQNFYVRINPPSSAHGINDCSALRSLSCLPGLVIPKVRSCGDVDSVIKLLGDKRGCVRVITLLESFDGLPFLHDVARHPNVVALAIGMEDLLTESAYDPLDTESLIAGVKRKVVMAAKSERLLAIDTISTVIRSPELFEKSCEESRGHGFDGRFIIHPSQVVAANEVYGPRSEMITWAREIMALTDGDENIGYHSHNGRVISGPMVKKAKTIIGFISN